MWTLDTENNKWNNTKDSISKEDFDYLKQSLDSVRFYSRCLSGATYYPVNDLNNIYDVLGSGVNRNWYVTGQYSITSLPSEYQSPITSTSSNEYYNKFIPEYGLTLKNLFTPTRLINDSMQNFIYVDACTTESVQDIGQSVIGLTIDGVRLKYGHRVLIKDQITTVDLLNTVDPDSYFYPTKYYKSLEQPSGSLDTSYYYYGEENGIYIYNNSNKLVRESDLDIYEDCIRYSICVKLGDINKDKQFHLSRMMNGYYSSVSENQPIEFIEKHNWIIRNRVDYNNVLDLNYYDVLKHDAHYYYDMVKGVTFSIPQRLIGVGEFGGIINYQNDTLHIIENKFKVNLRSISEVDGYYWICGDGGTLLKVSKVDFNVEKFDLELLGTLRSISFFNNLRGVVVGDFNTIFYTDNGGYKWNKISIDVFNPYSYNKVLYYGIDKFFIGGDSGVFLEFILVLNEWVINKKRVAKYLTTDDEYLLVDDINDIISFKTSNWNLTYSYSTQSIPSNKECLMLVTNSDNFIVYNLNEFVDSDFLYLNFTQSYGDINGISLRENTLEFYFASQEIYSFDINNFQIISSSESNVVSSNAGAILSQSLYVNKISDYNGSEILVAGNNSLLDFATYSYTIDSILDINLNNRLKSKLLFLDYDIAGKLNFFDDQQNYRMPNSLTFSGASFSTSSYINFDTLPNEKNWLTYWKDREKVFEYYSTMSDANIVLSSTTFSYSTQSVFGTYTASQISISLSDIINLAPRIGEEGHSRYISGTGPSISSPSTPFSIYLYKYLMIVKTPILNKSDVGDVIQMNSDTVDGKFTINKIFTNATHSYHYMFTNFNENIINNLKSGTYTITLTNLNKYISPSDFSSKLNLHPISNAYNTTYSNGIVKVSNVFNRISSYYNLGTEVDLSGTIHSMMYADTFLLFGYKPNYNILSYLENINSNFNAAKELLAMPNYYYIPGPDYPGLGGLTSSNIDIDTNKLAFGEELKLEWESLFIYTYVDVILYVLSSSVSYSTRLLITNKYYVSNYNNSGQGVYIIEFHKNINYTQFDDIEYVSIVSRRLLSQISDDLQELNNIQRPNTSIKSTQIGFTYSNYESELNFKFPTDSYAKILLSDNDILSSLSGIMYIDYKNELSLNITRLASEVELTILTTSLFGSYLYISCLEKHGLSEGDGVILEFNGGTGSSQTFNPQYFGFQTVGIAGASEYDFFVYTAFGLPSIVNGDPGIVRFTRKDPFLNYQPVDLIDLGVDKKTKISVEIRPENVDLVGTTYKLINIDTKKYKFKIFDGLTLDIINSLYPWILEAEISDALLGMDENQNLIWYSGIWHFGRWFGSSNGKTATWVSGIWVSGDWYGGIWKSNDIDNKFISISIQNTTNNRNSIWFDGRWFDGTWEGGTWYNGRRYAGTWNSGDWYNGIWNDGTWEDGNFIGGIWVLGNWKDGIFNTDNKPSYWIAGNWDGGDFENGMWYSGVWDQKNNKISRFGTKSYNSRTSTWHGGKWISGDFHSRLNLDDDGLPDVSISHKLSVWKTGLWSNGNWYGGISYNIDFRSGNWFGGILEDIQVTGVNIVNQGGGTYSTLQLNGIFKFNIGDDFTVIDNNIGSQFSIYGSNDNPIVYKVLNQVENGDFTTLYVDKDFTSKVLTTGTHSSVNLKLRVVSKFESAKWESGIWTNGIFKNGTWNGGIWYNGVFDGSWG